ncbi:9184_t:CDS:1, partial [Funneliformis geosporum]
ENKKKDFHNICSVAFLNPITLEIEECNKPSMQRLWNLIGNVEINSNCVVEVNRNIERLGVCNFYMNLDKRLDFQPSGLRSNIDPSFVMISSKRCLFYGHCFYVYTRGTNCQTHA